MRVDKNSNYLSELLNHTLFNNLHLLIDLRIDSVEPSGSGLLLNLNSLRFFKTSTPSAKSEHNYDWEIGKFGSNLFDN